MSEPEPSHGDVEWGEPQPNPETEPVEPWADGETNDTSEATT